MKQLSTPETQAAWLGQDIPHRVRASLALSTLLDDMLARSLPDEAERAKKAQFCLEMAAWEGKQAATRWLIDFIGLNADQSGKPKPSAKRNRSGRAHDVDIEDLPGGTYFPLTGSDAELLAQVWLGCSKATSHPTLGSQHPDISRDRLSQATCIIVNHLNSTAYAFAGRTLVF